MSKSVSIPRADVVSLEVGIVGDTPLLMNKFTKSARDDMLGKQTGKATKGKDARDPEAEFRARIYRVDGEEQQEDPRDVDPESGTFGIKTMAFKLAMADMAKQDGMDVAGTHLRRGIQVLGEMTPIYYDQIVMDERLVSLGGRGNTKTIRFRPKFLGWRADLRLRVMPVCVSVEQAVSLLNMAGTSVGVGDYRVESGGNFGMFHVDVAESPE